MRYQNKEIREHLIWFVEHTGQTELQWVVPYCLGRYGCVTKQIWFVIGDLVKEGILKW